MADRGRVHKLCLKTLLQKNHITANPPQSPSLSLSLHLSAHVMKECEDVAARGAESTWKRNALVSLHTV